MEKYGFQKVLHDIRDTYIQGKRHTYKASHNRQGCAKKIYEPPISVISVTFVKISEAAKRSLQAFQVNA